METVFFLINYDLQDKDCPDFQECLNYFALLFWLAGKYQHPIISDLQECKFPHGTDRDTLTHDNFSFEYGKY